MSRRINISDLVEAETVPASSNSDEDDDSGSVAGWSLTSEVTNFTFENGRRYHGFGVEGSYLYPNDEKECERLDLQHHAFRLLLDGELTTIPDPKFKRVLDLGTGTGIWAIDLADAYPDAKIRGVDLSPIQPEWVPENVVFEIDDIEQKWNWPTRFDFIHMRMLMGSIASWSRLLKQAYDNLTPGGWIESQEMLMVTFSVDDSLPEDSNWKKWERLFNNATKQYGRPFSVADRMKKWLENAGFIDVEEKIIECPFGAWESDPILKDKGRFMKAAIYDGLQGFSLGVFTRVLGWKADEVEAFIALCRNDMNNPAFKAYYKFYFVRGRKPGVESPRASFHSSRSGAVQAKEKVEAS